MFLPRVIFAYGLSVKTPAETWIIVKRMVDYDSRERVREQAKKNFEELRPTLMRDRKRKIPDRKSVVFDLSKNFSFREQKLSCVRSKNRLDFSCGVSGMPTVGITRNLKFEYRCTQ